MQRRSFNSCGNFTGDVIRCSPHLSRTIVINATSAKNRKFLGAWSYTAHEPRVAAKVHGAIRTNTRAVTGARERVWKYSQFRDDCGNFGRNLIFSLHALRALIYAAASIGASTPLDVIQSNDNEKIWRKNHLARSVRRHQAWRWPFEKEERTRWQIWWKVGCWRTLGRRREQQTGGWPKSGTPGLYSDKYRYAD